MMNNQNPLGNINAFMQRLNQLKSMGGDPNEQIQKLMNSGRITQADYDNAVKTAQQIRKMFGM